MTNPTEADGKKILVSTEQIQKRVRELAKQISEDYRGQTLCAIGVMENSFMFFADLVRALEIPVLCQFIKPKLNEKPRGSSTAMEIFYSPDVEVKGHHVLLIEGLVQSGITSDFLMHNLKARGALSVKLAAFLDKSSARRVQLRPDYFGFIMDESFVMGYGLGGPEVGRNLPYVTVTVSKGAAAAQVE